MNKFLVHWSEIRGPVPCIDNLYENISPGNRRSLGLIREFLFKPGGVRGRCCRRFINVVKVFSSDLSCSS